MRLINIKAEGKLGMTYTGTGTGTMYQLVETDLGCNGCVLKGAGASDSDDEESRARCIDCLAAPCFTGLDEPELVLALARDGFCGPDEPEGE